MAVRFRRVDEPNAVSLHIPAATVFKVLLILALFGVGLRFLQLVAPLLISLVVAIFFAVAADPAVRKIESRGLGRGASVGVFMLMLLLVLVGLTAVLIPPLVEQSQNLVEEAPTYVSQVRDNEQFQRLDERFNLLERAGDQLQELPAKVSAALTTIVGAVAKGVFGVFTVLFLMMFLLTGGRDLVAGAARLYPRIVEPRWWAIISAAYHNVGGYVTGMLTAASIAGVSLFVVLQVVGLSVPGDDGVASVALPLALWMMLMSMIPLIGATIGAMPSVVVAYVTGGFWAGSAVLVFILVYQQLESVFIHPRILGHVVSLSPFFVFVSVLVGGQVLGVLGALLAIPIAGVIQILVHDFLVARDGIPDAARIDLPDIPDEPATEHDRALMEERNAGGESQTDTIRLGEEPPDVTDHTLDDD